jgi:hypothetical protein
MKDTGNAARGSRFYFFKVFAIAGLLLVIGLLLFSVKVYAPPHSHYTIRLNRLLFSVPHKALRYRDPQVIVYTVPQNLWVGEAARLAEHIEFSDSPVSSGLLPPLVSRDLLVGYGPCTVSTGSSRVRYSPAGRPVAADFEWYVTGREPGRCALKILPPLASSASRIHYEVAIISISHAGISSGDTATIVALIGGGAVIVSALIGLFGVLIAARRRPETSEPSQRIIRP